MSKRKKRCNVSFVEIPNLSPEDRMLAEDFKVMHGVDIEKELAASARHHSVVRPRYEAYDVVDSNGVPISVQDAYDDALANARGIENSYLTEGMNSCVRGPLTIITGRSNSGKSTATRFVVDHNTILRPIDFVGLYLEDLSIAEDYINTLNDYSLERAYEACRINQVGAMHINIDPIVDGGNPEETLTEIRTLSRTYAIPAICEMSSYRILDSGPISRIADVVVTTHREGDHIECHMIKNRYGMTGNWGVPLRTTQERRA